MADGASQTDMTAGGISSLQAEVEALRASLREAAAAAARQAEEAEGQREAVESARRDAQAARREKAELEAEGKATELLLRERGVALEAQKGAQEVVLGCTGRSSAASAASAMSN
jgi:hypothetical protein